MKLVMFSSFGEPQPRDYSHSGTYFYILVDKISDMPCYTIRVVLSVNTKQETVGTE